MSHCEDRAIIFKYIILVLDCYDLRKILWAWYKKNANFACNDVASAPILKKKAVASVD